EHLGSMLSRLFGPRDAGLTARANEMLGFFRLDKLADELAGGLSYGQQKLLDAAMAFMAGPRLVLLDEPAGGVNLTMLASLHGLSFGVRRGAITTVIGPNGAGKSTAFKALFGMLAVRAGRVLFEERDVTNRSPRALIAAGICYVPQGRNIFPELTVFHNLE